MGNTEGQERQEGQVETEEHEEILHQPLAIVQGPPPSADTIETPTANLDTNLLRRNPPRTRERPARYR